MSISSHTMTYENPGSNAGGLRRDMADFSRDRLARRYLRVRSRYHEGAGISALDEGAEAYLRRRGRGPGSRNVLFEDEPGRAGRPRVQLRLHGVVLRQRTRLSHGDVPALAENREGAWI